MRTVERQSRHLQGLNSASGKIILVYERMLGGCDARKAVKMIAG